MRTNTPSVLGAAFVAAACLAGPAAAQQVKELTFWSHWAAEMPKRTFVEEAIKAFEAKNPGIKLKQTWYEKTALYAGLKTALRAGQAPDIFYAEPDQVEYMENGFLLDLSDLNWKDVEPWAKEAWTYQGKPYGLPLEAWTQEVYYNKKMMADLGVKVEDGTQLSADAFLDMVKKAKAKNITPMALGVGDRPYPGAHLIHEALLQKLGIADYDKLLKGKLPWTDPRVVDTLKWVRSLTEVGLLPTTFTTLKLAEAHIYFHTNPGALTFLNGSWYTSRAFNPPDKGGQPKDFPLGIMKFPAVPGATCTECRSIAIGGSYVGNAATKNPKEVLAFLNTFATYEMGNRWLDNVQVQTGIKSDPAKLTGPLAADYFKMIEKANAGAKYYFGIPVQVMTGKPKEVFIQVMNNAFPAGTISVEDAAKQMNAAY
jgi:multiple sugar transport system substrate-binding protein